MIQVPKRSVTRFFIPLIDVLTLLFCTFLLLPILKATTSEGADTRSATPEQQIAELKRELERRSRETPEALRQELEKLRTEKIQVLQDRLAIRTLEIDDKDGHLFYRDAVKRQSVPISSEVDAQRLIEEDRQRLAPGKQELYYLILYPRVAASEYPTRGELQRYEGWFKDVAHGFDRTFARPTSGGS